MNPYMKNLNRLEFSVTLACTGTCKHCSQGSHKSRTEHLDGDTAADLVHKVCQNFQIDSLMTFGGEPLLFAEDIYKIHAEAKRMGIPKRQIITNGFFSKDPAVIKETAEKLAVSGVNDVLLSVDAFHQETIPLEPVKLFAQAIQNTGAALRTQPAWLVHKDHENPYNQKTKVILSEFTQLGIREGSGNIIFPEGNAVQYLSEYFTEGELPVNPYDEDPKDVRAICVSANGDVLGGNVYDTDILDLIETYKGQE